MVDAVIENAYGYTITSMAKIMRFLLKTNIFKRLKLTSQEDKHGMKGISLSDDRKNQQETPKYHLSDTRCGGWVELTPPLLGEQQQQVPLPKALLQSFVI